MKESLTTESEFRDGSIRRSSHGHLRAADALVAAFAARGVSARHIEILRYTNPIFRKIYSDLYVDLMTAGPDLLGWLYKTFDRPGSFRSDVWPWIDSIRARWSK